MRRVSLVLALFGALAVAGCGDNDDDGGDPPVVTDTAFLVTVERPTAGGYVTSTPPGINCGVGDDHAVCSFEFPIGTPVALTATPVGLGAGDRPNLFLGWAGSCTGTGGCALGGNDDKLIQVSFGPPVNIHANLTAPSAHAPEMFKNLNGEQGAMDCRQCHGQALQGMGVAVSCQTCHSSPASATAARENCASCHTPGYYGTPANPHAIKGMVAVSATPAVVNGADVEFTVNVKLDGVNSGALTTLSRAYRFAYVTAREATTVLNAFERFSLTIPTQAVVAAPVNGDYKVTLPGMAATVGTTPTTFLVTLTDNNTANPQAQLYATAVSHINGKARDLVGDQACVNCHGSQVFRHREDNGEFHHGANPYGVEGCVVCHTRYGSVSRGMGGDRLTAYVHGIHNSHNIPARAITAASIDPDGSSGPLPAVAGPFTVTKPEGVYARNDSLRFSTTTYAADAPVQISSPFEVGFPSYMNNCSNCHDTDARLTAVMAKRVSASTCMSCHDNWDGFVNTREGGSLAGTHRGIALPVAGTATANPCAGCHNGTIAFATVGDVHAKRAAYTERAGLLYDGKDQSIAKGALIRLEITGVSFANPTTTTVTNVVSFARASDVVTVTTSAAHGLATGDYVNISGNSPQGSTPSFSGGSKLITVSGDATAFTYYEKGSAGTQTPTTTRTVTPQKRLVVTWKAYDNKGTASTSDDTEYDPCNTDIAAAPVFMNLTADTAVPGTGRGASNMSILQAYAQGNDWVNAGVGTSPGQPPSAPTLASAAGLTQNTTCASNVATSSIPAATTSATRGVVSLQGKPQITFTDTTPDPDYTRIIAVRSKSPTREFVVATGALPAAAEQRRQIVSIDKCNACHAGAVYQHGGNRVDSIDLCVMCHNPAANEKNGRVGMGVDATEAYDGKAGETYDLRYMIHAIHSAGETGAPLVYYRSNGIYAWGSAETLAALPNWESGTPAECTNAVPDSHGATLVQMFKVYGSTATGTIPTVDPTTGKCKVKADNSADYADSTDGTWRTHNAHVVHYPRALNDCGACHVNGSERNMPDQAQQMAVTVDAGGTPWGGQNDDLLLGPVAASCFSCHQSGVAADQSMLRNHAYGFGWEPRAFGSGRQTLINTP